MAVKLRAEWGLLLGSLVLILVAGEVFVRAFAPPSLPRLGYAPVRDARATLPQNALGYRDVDHDAPKKPGVRRALFLGDSFTYGQGVTFDDAFPKRVERLLTSSRKESWETIVIAIPGIGTGREARLLERDGLQFDPTVLVVGYVLNDGEAHDDGEQRRAAEWIADEELARNPPWWTGSAFLGLLGSRVRATIQNRRREENYKSLFEGEKPGFAGSKQSLMKIGTLASERGIPWILAVFPLFANPLDESYPFTAAHERIAMAGKAAGARVVDLLPSYRGMDWRVLVVEGANDEHPNELAHRIASETIADAIDDLIPRNP
jgi:hypothetical protein